MNTILVISEIFFYFTFSFAIIFITIISGMSFYRLIRLIKEFDKLVKNISDTSEDIGEKINYIIESFFEIPIISYFFKKPKSKINKSSRKINK